ncbi:hypothetical protein ACJMK2_007778 [Sinanodonta woodiana]|uniref:THAP-type domain-containing protein n=1 Tax=Sinanodonta woodiana TaxID=1069815 RepID=A0ABD3VJJ4_SINWO
MVLRCAWGTCNADERYPERLEGGCFIRFPTPKRDLEKVKRWIKACGRPHKQLNIARINQHKAVCSKHFVGVNGPSENYPDPIQADGLRTMPVRKLPGKRASSQQSETSQHKYKCLHLEEDFTTLNSPDMNCDLESGVSTQTEHACKY